MDETTLAPGRKLALLTDLYQLTMLQAYFVEGMRDTAVFDLFVRRLPEQRNYLVAAGLHPALEYLATLEFSSSDLAYLDSLGRFRKDFLDYLADFRFTGDVHAVPEGTVVFADEPLLEVIAPLPQAQVVESFLLNQVHFQTLIASKAARVIHAAAGRTVVDFGLRRYHGIDAGMQAARASWLAGVDATSNVLAGKTWGIPVSGTMAHSYVLAHDSEEEAFKRFAGLYPDTVLLVDTYDTLEGVRKVIELARNLGERFRVSAIRLDSGEIGTLARAARDILDRAGLERVQLFVSGDLDEYHIEGLLAGGAPIAGLGVGTRMGTSADAPFLNCAYKLVEYAGENRMKLSRDKATLPGRKQVFRLRENGLNARDIISRHDERCQGTPLLRPVMQSGNILRGALPDLAASRDYCAAERAALPATLKSLEAGPPYTVELSETLAAAREDLKNRLQEREHHPRPADSGDRISR
jgi:nicotinate phosphoribosyltransferase